MTKTIRALPSQTLYSPAQDRFIDAVPVEQLHTLQAITWTNGPLVGYAVSLDDGEIEHPLIVDEGWAHSLARGMSNQTGRLAVVSSFEYVPRMGSRQERSAWTGNVTVDARGVRVAHA